MSSPTNPGLSVGGLLDIIIVVVALYAALSWLLSTLHERIAEALKLRGAKLRQGILNLTCGHDELLGRIFNHGLIVSSSDDRGEHGWRPMAVLSLKPAANAGMPRSMIAARDVKAGRTVSSSAMRPYTPSYIDARNFSLAFWQSLATLTSPKPVDPSSASYKVALTIAGIPDELRDGLARALDDLTVGNPPLHDAVTALLVAAEGKYDRLLAATDGWFEAQMDRVSGWYARQTQWIIAIMAFLLVSFTGIDSIDVVTRLYAQPSLRSAFSQQITARFQEAPPPDPATVFGSDQTNGLISQWIAWSPNPFANWLHHPVGLLITFAAITIGGPAWFDILCNLASVNARAAGRKPKRADQPPR